MFELSAAASAAKSLQSCPTLHEPMDCSPPGSSIHGIFQARVLEWGASAFSILCASFINSQEKTMAPHSSTLAWKIPWMEEPGGLQSMGSWRVGHDWATSFSLFTFHFHALEKEMANPLQCSCLEKPRDGGAWWAAVYGVAQTQTGLKRLSSSSSINSHNHPLR